MSRIRSVHPGLWTDEAFVELSFPARMLLMGIWTECDDGGAFVWRPLTLADPLGQTTRTAWYAECVRTGLADPISPEDKGRARESKTSKFRKYMAEFKAAGLIGVDGETVYDLRKTRTASP
jgi:hypothetical protein